MHRTRALELKDGNLLNEVRMLCDSLLENDGALAENMSIKYAADKSVLNLKIGDRVQLSAAELPP